LALFLQLLFLASLYAFFGADILVLASLLLLAPVLPFLSLFWHCSGIIFGTAVAVVIFTHPVLFW